MPYTKLQRPVELLLVEDNLAEIRLFEEALKAATISLHLSVVRDGDDALTFLRRQAPYTQAIRPDLILLDLNLPGKSGLEVLHDLSAEPQLRQIPSIVITNSQAEEDILRSYELCANCYVVKPTDFATFQQIMTQLQDFWLGAATLPSFVRSG
jgi:chemotaxis family two-component system response regulator Rcp1